MSIAARALDIARRRHRADGGNLSNYEAADKALNLTPQEKSLYERHLSNLWGGRGTTNSDGSHSTLYQMVSGDGAGKYYNVPTVYEGRILPPDEAWQRAKEQGLNTFPSYSSPDYADDRYDKMHQFMEKDIGPYTQEHQDQGQGFSKGGRSVANALRVARRKRDAGGVTKVHVPKLNSAKVHVGPIHSSVPGRTDHLPLHTPNGSYVVPADVVSSHGEGNTRAGFGTLEQLFGTPSRTKGAPYGEGGNLPYHAVSPLAKGGAVEDGADEVPLVVAGGEYSMAPEQLMRLGTLLKIPSMTLDDAHKIMDQFVLQSRADHIKTLKGLPAPRRD